MCKCVAHSWWEKGRSCVKMKSCPTTHFETAKLQNQKTNIELTINMHCEKYMYFWIFQVLRCTCVHNSATDTRTLIQHTYTD